MGRMCDDQCRPGSLWNVGWAIFGPVLLWRSCPTVVGEWLDGRPSAAYGLASVPENFRSGAGLSKKRCRVEKLLRCGQDDVYRISDSIHLCRIWLELLYSLYVVQLINAFESRCLDRAPCVASLFPAWPDHTVDLLVGGRLLW